MLQFPADTSETRRKYDKLTDVVSTSGDTVEFARNFNDYLNERIPYGITIGILAVLCLIAFIITLVGKWILENKKYCKKRDFWARYE